MKTNSLLSTSAAILSLVACLVPSALAQTYNWDGNGSPNTGGNWSTGINWNPDAPANDPGTGDTANLVDTGANRVVTYDAGASGLLGTLNFNQTSAFTNTLDLARNLNVTSAITLGATTGVEEIRISPGAATLTLIVPTLNIATGGLLTMKFGTANAQQPVVQGAISMTGGNVTVVSGLAGTAAQAPVTGNFAMSGGTLTIGTGNDTRIQVSGNFTATGGAITGGTLSLLGATNSLTGTTLTSTSIFLEGSVAQSLSSSANLGSVLLRNNAATDVVKILTLTGAATTVGQLQFRTPTAGRATNLVLGSNLSSSASAANPSMIASVAGTVGAGIDTAGFTLDLSTSSAGVWTPNNVSGANLVNWNLTNSAGSGKIKAAGFNFSSANQVNVGAGLTLEASGGNAATINVSGGGSIDAASTIRYSGAAATGTPALLTSNRTIGNLNVASGALKVSGSSITAAGLLTVGSGATLDLSAFGLTANGLVFDNGSLNTPANLTIVGAGSTVVKTGASTLTLSNTANSYAGTTTVQDGALKFSGNVPVGANSALGNASSAIIVGTASSTVDQFIQLLGTTAGTVSRYINATGGTSSVNTSSGANRYRVGADITAGGTLTYDGAIAYGSVGGLVQGRDLELTAVQSNTTTVINGLISSATGAGSVIINGSQSGIGTVKLTNAANSFTGNLKVVMGTLLVGGDAPVGGTSVLGNSTGAIALADGGTPASNWTISGGLNSGDAGNPAVLTDGAYTVARAVNLSNAASYVGGAAPTTLGNGSANSYIIGGNSASNSTFSGNVTVTSNTANKLLRLTQVAAGTVTLSGVINPNADATAVLNVEKIGAGTVILSGANIYDGTTNVTAGTLLANNTSGSATGSGNVTVASGATLGGTGTIGGATTIIGSVSPGDGGIGTLNIANNVTWKGASNNGTNTDWIFQLGSNNTADLLNITGDFIKDSTYGSVFRFDFGGSTNAGTFKLVDWSGTSSFNASDFSFTNLGAGLTGSFAFNGSQLEFRVVPEPSTWVAMVALAFGGGLALIRRRC